MNTLCFHRPTHLFRPKWRNRRLPVYGNYGGLSVLPEAPMHEPLGLVLKLVRQLRREGQFIGISLNVRYYFQAVCEVTCAEEFRAGVLDKVRLTTQSTTLTRAQLAVAVRAAYSGLDIVDSLRICNWSSHQLIQSFAE